MSANGWFETGSCSLVGDRAINQDRTAVFRGEDALFLVLADGLGGHPRGERAAEIVVETCKEAFEASARPIPDPARFLTRTLHKAHERITLFGLEQRPPIEPRTTVVAALIQAGEMLSVHAGDSRLYLLREHAPFYRTTDDSYIELLRQQGIAADRQQDTSARRHFVTKCLGGSLLLPEILPERTPLERGDLLVLCSDGFWSQVDEVRSLETLSRSENLRMTTNRMAHEAVQAAPGGSDNVSLVTLRITDLPGKRAGNDDRHREPDDENMGLETAVRILEAALNEHRSNET